MNRSENYKKYKRNCLILDLLLVIALALAGVVTYAWFTKNTKATIDTMKLSVSVTKGVEISGDAVTWGNQITIDDLYKSAGMVPSKSSKHVNAGAINQFPSKLRNISSAGNVVNNRLELFHGVAENICKVGDEYQVLQKTNNDGETEGVQVDLCSEAPVVGLTRLTKYYEGNTDNNLACGIDQTVTCENANLEAENDSNYGVIAFDMYIKLNDDAEVSLGVGSYAVGKNLPDSPVLSAEELSLKNTIRVAFVTLGTQPSDFYYAENDSIYKSGTIIDGNDVTGIVKDYTDDETQTGISNRNYINVFGGYAGVYGARTMNTFGEIAIWEPNYTSHTANGESNYYNNYAKFIDLEKTMIKPGTFQIIDPTAGVYNINGITLPMPLTEANVYDNPDYFANQTNVVSGYGPTSDHKNKLVYIKTAKEEIDENYKMFDLAAGVTKIRVYMWVEGNDIDTENNATNSKVDVSINITTAEQPNNLNIINYTGINDKSKAFNSNFSMDPTQLGTASN